VARAPLPGVHIGIFGTGMPWKNVDTQMLAAALVIKTRRGGMIHVQHIADPSLMKALGVEYEVHPRMDSGEFYALLASMTVNMAVNFTETFGYVVVESFLLGVPCLFSPMTQALFGLDRQSPLWRCRVERIDDPAFIAEKISEVLEQREEIAAAGAAFCRRHVSDLQSPAGSEGGGWGRPFPIADRVEPSPVRNIGLFERILRYRSHRLARPLLAPMFEVMKRIRDTSDVLAMTPVSSGQYCLGVNRATHALFPGAVLELASEIAGSPSCSFELQELARYTAALQFSQVIFSGFPPCAESLARRIRGSDIRVGCMFHGFISEFGQDHSMNQLFQTILQLCREGVIARLACNKKGLPQTIERIAGIRAYKFMVPTRVAGGCGVPRRRSEAGGLHIGVLAYDLFRKNIHNQVAAALLIDGATVHVSGEPALDYWGCNHRLIRHPKVMPHRDYVDLLGQMDLNLHLSFSESWGQVTAESLAMGVPCIIANHSDMYDHDPVLRDRLVSANFDDAEALSEDIRIVLNERDVLAERGRGYVEVLNQRAEAYLKEFLTP
jgi:glycosyltransferase involved in cell wall biosynthesis